MPHLTLELSSNIIEQSNLNILLQKCHTSLTKTLPANIEDCKSRIIVHKNFYIGDKNINQAFIYANLKVMPGRTTETLNAAANEIMHILQAHFNNSLQTFKLQISLELHELPSIYLKHCK